MGWPVAVSIGIGGCSPQCAAFWLWELSKSTEGENWDGDEGDGHRYARKPRSWDWEQLLHENVLSTLILDLVFLSPVLLRSEMNLPLLRNGVWSYSGSGILPRWV